MRKLVILKAEEQHLFMLHESLSCIFFTEPLARLSVVFRLPNFFGCLHLRKLNSDPSLMSLEEDIFVHVVKNELVVG